MIGLSYLYAVWAYSFQHIAQDAVVWSNPSSRLLYVALLGASRKSVIERHWLKVFLRNYVYV